MPESAGARRSLALFTLAGYDKGRSRLWQAAWFATMNLIFSQWWCPAVLRPWLLRRFGAEVGARVFIRHRVRILWPWKLVVGNDAWIGEGAWLLNLEPIRLGDDVCISQEVFLCTGSHDRRAVNFRYTNAPIEVERGAWIAARAMILPGVTVMAGATVPAGAVVRVDVQAGPNAGLAIPAQP